MPRWQLCEQKRQFWGKNLRQHFWPLGYRQVKRGVERIECITIENINITYRDVTSGKSRGGYSVLTVFFPTGSIPLPGEKVLSESKNRKDRKILTNWYSDKNTERLEVYSRCTYIHKGHGHGHGHGIFILATHPEGTWTTNPNPRSPNIPARFTQQAQGATVRTPELSARQPRRSDPHNVWEQRAARLWEHFAN